jgi:hypothetical protein
MMAYIAGGITGDEKYKERFAAAKEKVHTRMEKAEECRVLNKTRRRASTKHV